MSKSDKEYLLIKGDISGIQKFIFNVYSKGAAKSLRGKSAYINFLTLVCVHKILDELEIEKDSIIYQGGGNFYLQVLNKENITSKLADIRTKILNNLKENFEGDIYLALDWIEVSRKELNENIGNSWRSINEKVRKMGQSKWKELIEVDESIFNDFFYIGDPNKENEICPVCKGNFKGKEDRVEIKEDEYICRQCHIFQNIASEIRDAEYLCIQKWNGVKRTEKEFRILDYTIKLSKEKVLTNECIAVYKFNDRGLENNLYFPTHTPEGDFDGMAERSLGADKLGILKLDVDNLGKVFTEKKSSIEFKKVSGQFKKFFEGRLNELAHGDDYKDNIYIIYSGGDDTFIVGSYDKILTFTRMLKKEFDKEFNTDGKEKVTFSAGLLIVDMKQGVKSFAEKVEEYLERAKDNGKDAVVIFGEVFSWDEYGKLLELKESIKKIVEVEGSKSILSKIMDSTKGFLSATRTKNFNERKKRVWRLSYYLRNRIEAKDEVEGLIKIYEDLALNRAKKDYTNGSIIPVATRIAEFETRKGR